MAEIHNEQRVLGVRIIGDGAGGENATGTVEDAAYSDATGAADGTIISLLKGIYVQNEAVIALLTSIEANTNAGV